MFTHVGFGQKPQIAFPGAVTGRLRPYKTWRPIEQATMSYGYGLSASLFQMAHAYTVFARDGEMIPVTMHEGQRPAAGRRARVVGRRPRGRCARCCSWPPARAAPRRRRRRMGYSVGGKTGTAHKQEGKGYASNKYRCVVRRHRADRQAAHHRRGDGRRAEQRQVLRRRRRRAGVQRRSCSRRCACSTCRPTSRCKPQIVRATCRPSRRASDADPPQIARRSGPLAARLGQPARCAPTAARCGRATPSSPGPAT